MSRIASALVVLFLLAGCANQPPQHERVSSSPSASATAPAAAADADTPPVATTTATYDPWERFNRRIYRFNARFDESIHLPISRGYQRVVPQPMRTGVGNFFANLGEVGNTANYLLQGRPRYSLRSAGRFLINSTVGLVGLFDVADKIGLSRTPTSFGNTLGRWGVGAGPYLVLPVLGPSTLRDGVGQAADFGLTRSVDAGGFYSSDSALEIGTVNAVDARTRTGFRYYQTGSPFEYELVRFLFTRKRAIEIDGTQTLPDEPRSEPSAATPANESNASGPQLLPQGLAPE